MKGAPTWAIVLAGGEGTRVRGLTRDRDGQPAPKQFCDVGTGRTLVGTTLHRASRVAGSQRVVLVVMRLHRKWWSDETNVRPETHVEVQAGDLGTAVAVRAGILHALRHADDPNIVLMPSDHAADDDDLLTGAICGSLAHALSDPASILLLGVRPNQADTSYGWIVPDHIGSPGPCAVRSFVEKPPPVLAKALLDHGALWNTMIVIARARTLLELHENRARTGAAVDFSRDVLQSAPERLRVLELPACGWTDLGTPERLRNWQARAEAGSFRSKGVETVATIR